MDLDHARYRKMLHDKVKNSLSKHIINGDLIGKENGKTVKIPVKMIDIPRLRFKRPEEEIVYGDGESQAGDQEGEDVLDVEFSLEDLAKLLVDEFQLRDLKSKKMTSENEIAEKYTSISSRGPQSLRHGRRTLKNALKRQIKLGTYDPEKPVIIPVREDYMYRSGKPSKKYSDQVVSFMIRDVSASMEDYEIEMTRRLSYPIDLNFNHWYKKTINEYIIHNTIARFVNRDTFFRFKSSGGTMISSAYELCMKRIKDEYGNGECSIFVTHFTDGDNFSKDDDLKSCRILEQILPHINQFSFIQIPHQKNTQDSQFYNALFSYFSPKKTLWNTKVCVTQLQNEGKIPDVIKELFGVRSGRS